VYCENYSHCGKVWCPDSKTTHQKTHDLGLDVPVDLDVEYIIQTRTPLDSIASWYKSAKDNDWTDLSWPEFKAEKELFCEKFMKKWFSDNGRFRHIHYNMLIKYPLLAVQTVIGMDCDTEKVEKIVSKIDFTPRHHCEGYDFVE